MSQHESKKLLVYNYRNSLAIVVNEYHGSRNEQMLVYNYRNSTYNTCKRISRHWSAKIVSLQLS